MKALNQTAKKLIELLNQHGIPFRCGYFHGESYCIGVDVKSMEDAFQLGQKITDYKGVLGISNSMIHSNGALLAFRDALVSQ